MGKLLRSRQILDQTDFQCENIQNTYPIKGILTKKSLKKSICKTFQKRGKNQTKKHQNFINNLQKGSLSQIVDETKFQCPICLQLMVRPTLMSCGHIYCYRCLESNTAHSSSCCLCRLKQNPDHFIPSALTQNLINEYLNSSYRVILPRSNQIIKYLCRTTDCQEWIKRREINNLRPGLIVDFQDAFKVWRRGIVLKTYIGKDQKQMVNIKTFFKGTEILQNVEASSKRLAPLNFFTRGKYLEEFVPVLPQYEDYEKQLERLQYRYTQESSQELFNLANSSQQDGLAYTQIQLEHQQAYQGRDDQALALFNWEMNGTELLF